MNAPRVDRAALSSNIGNDDDEGKEENPSTIEENVHVLNVLPSPMDERDWIAESLRHSNSTALKVLDMLIVAGADPNSMDDSCQISRSKLEIALRSGNDKLVNALVAAGADVQRYGVPILMGCVHDLDESRLERALTLGINPLDISKRAKIWYRHCMFSRRKRQHLLRLMLRRMNMSLHRHGLMYGELDKLLVEMQNRIVRKLAEAEQRQKLWEARRTLLLERRRRLEPT